MARRLLLAITGRFQSADLARDPEAMETFLKAL